MGMYIGRDRPMKEKKDQLQSSWLCTMTRVGTERERERASDCLKWCHKSRPERKHWWPLLSSCPLPLAPHPTPPPARVRLLALSRCILYCTFMYFKSRRPHPQLTHKSSSGWALKATEGREESMWAYRQCSERSLIGNYIIGNWHCQVQTPPATQTEIRVTLMWNESFGPEKEWGFIASHSSVGVCVCVFGEFAVLY